jgi:hypothetical protein
VNPLKRLPEPLRRQVEKGRVAAAEVAAPVGRRAFLVIRPVGGADTLEAAAAQFATGGMRPVTAYSVTHDEFDATELDGYDYDVGWTRLREAEARTLEEVETLIATWGYDAGVLLPHHQTDAP